MTMTITVAAAAAAAATTCPGRGWGHPKGFPRGVSPSPPQHFTFEPPVGPSGPSRPRRRYRRVLYPPAVRRPLPTEEPSVAKRLLVLLLAVVSAQVYSATEDVTPEVAATAVVTPEISTVTPEALTTPVVTSPPGDRVLLRTAVTLMGTTWTPNGTLVGTPVGASCPRLLLSPALWPHNYTTGGAAR